MTVLKHELWQGRTALLIWTGSVAFLLAVSILLFPEMKGEMGSVGDMFSQMGSFTAAFGMDKLNFGTMSGYYIVECGNVLGLGGAFFAALCAVQMLSKEERGRTAEFLLTHPVSRRRVVTEKLAALGLQITAMNLAILAVAAGCVAAIGEEIPWKEIGLIHLAYYLLQLELAGICFGISAFLTRGGVGIGLGVAFGMYFLNILSNITESAKSLKYITPYAYCDGAYITAEGSLEGGKLLIGLAYCLMGVAAAYWQYQRKDIS